MGNVYFLSTNFLIFYIFLLILMNMQKQNLHISTLNKKTMAGLQFGTRVGILG